MRTGLLCTSRLLASSPLETSGPLIGSRGLGSLRADRAVLVGLPLLHTIVLGAALLAIGFARTTGSNLSLALPARKAPTAIHSGLGLLSLTRLAVFHLLQMLTMYGPLCLHLVTSEPAVLFASSLAVLSGMGLASRPSIKGRPDAATGAPKFRPPTELHVLSPACWDPCQISFRLLPLRRLTPCSSTLIM